VSNSFLKDIKPIKLKDELSLFLGASVDGTVCFSYQDIVKSAGHSCPTVAGAYISTRYALDYLYEDELPKRGEIKVCFKNSLKDGTTGVIANVISQITGATKDSGFKGLNGNFIRHSLLDYNCDIDSDIRFSRVDNNKEISIIYDPSCIPANKDMANLMGKVINGSASKTDHLLFCELWQDRVKRIFDNCDKVIKVV